jgi:hypothetical protein
MSDKVLNEVLRMSAIGLAIGIPLKYYLLKNHPDRHTQNQIILEVVGFFVGAALFKDASKRLKK